MTLTDLVGRARCLLIDFDGPICSVFAGYPAAEIVEEMRGLIRDYFDNDLPAAIAELAPDPLELLAQVATLGDNNLSRKLGDACRDAEVAAVASAEPTPGAEVVLRLARRAGRRVVIVSNNSSAAIEAYLTSRDLIRYVDDIAARFDGMDPALLKPDPFLIKTALTAVRTQPADALFIGDSVTDIEAGQAAGTPTIGYANKPGKHLRLTAARADVVIDTMQSLAQALQLVANGPVT